MPLIFDGRWSFQWIMNRTARFPLLVAYAACAGTWIIAGDSVLRSFGLGSEALAHAHLPQSMLLIALTTGMLFNYNPTLLESTESGRKCAP